MRCSSCDKDYTEISSAWNIAAIEDDSQSQSCRCSEFEKEVNSTQVHTEKSYLHVLQSISISFIFSDHQAFSSPSRYLLVCFYLVIFFACFSSLLSLSDQLRSSTPLSFLFFLLLPLHFDIDVAFFFLESISRRVCEGRMRQR